MALKWRQTLRTSPLRVCSTRQKKRLLPEKSGHISRSMSSVSALVSTSESLFPMSKVTAFSKYMFTSNEIRYVAPGRTSQVKTCLSSGLKKSIFSVAPSAGEMARAQVGLT